MEWGIRVLGGFYVLGGLLIIRQARINWHLDRAIEKITLKPEPDRWLPCFTAVFGVIYLVAGVALAALSQWGLWLLGAGLVGQGLYQPLARYLAGEAEHEHAGERRRACNAAIFSAAVFALLAYAFRIGVLT